MEDLNVNDVLVVGFDDTEQAHRAVAFAAERAGKTDCSLHLVFVVEWSPYSFHTPEELAERHKRREEELERAHSLIQPIMAKLKDAGVSATCEASHGHAAELLCSIAEEKKACQLIIGRTSGSSFAQRLLGGVAITLAQVSPVPLTIVP